MKQFKCNISSCKYIFKSGKVAHFNCGIYNTAIAAEISELDEEISQGHPNIVSGAEVSAEDLDPMSALKSRVIAEFLAGQKSSASTAKDMGTTSQNSTTAGVATSVTIAPAAMGSNVTVKSN